MRFYGRVDVWVGTNFKIENSIGNFIMVFFRRNLELVDILRLKLVEF